MKKKLLYKTVVCLAVLSVAFSSCQKNDDTTLSADQSFSTLKSVQSSISRDKQDREILFISKRDVSFDEIYIMNVDGLNLVWLIDNLVSDGRVTWSANG